MPRPSEIIAEKLDKLEREYMELCRKHESTDPLILRIAFYSAAIVIAGEKPVDDEYAQNAILAYLERVRKISVEHLATRLDGKIDY